MSQSVTDTNIYIYMNIFNTVLAARINDCIRYTLTRNGNLKVQTLKAVSLRVFIHK